MYFCISVITPDTERDNINGYPHGVGRGSVLNETMVFAYTKAERGDVYGNCA